MEANEIKEYLYNCLTDEQVSELSIWINELKENGVSEKSRGINVEITLTPGTYNPFISLPRAVSHVVERQRMVKTS